MTESATPLIVCEKTGRWAVWLRPLLGDLPYRLVETRSLGSACQRAGEHPGPCVALETRVDNLTAVLEAVLGLRQRVGLRVVLLTSRSLRAEYQWVMRELGADYVADGPLELRPLRTILGRHAALAMPAVPAGSTCQRIMERIPW